MRLITTIVLMLFTLTTFGQTIGKVKAEEYTAEFEKKKSIDDVSDYWGDMIPVALLNVGISDDLYEMYPELRDGRVGLGLTNIVIEYLDWTNRFEFVEEKSEIKDRMKSQWVASRKGVSENQVYGLGKIKLAESEIMKLFSLTSTPFDLISLISSNKAQGSTTTPFPITDILFFLTIPEGRSLNL